MSVYIKLRGKRNSLTLGNDGAGLFFNFWNDRGEIENDGEIDSDCNDIVLAAEEDDGYFCERIESR